MQPQLARCLAAAVVVAAAVVDGASLRKIPHRHEDLLQKRRVSIEQDGKRVAVVSDELLFVKVRANASRSRARGATTTQIVHKTAYWGTISVGQDRKQSFDVIFDTGSGNLILPSSECTDSGCRPHKKYDASGKAMTNEFGDSATEITFGTGNIAGNFVSDTVCVGSQICLDANFIAAYSMSRMPFADLPFDGIMGLGFSDLSMGHGFNIIDLFRKDGRVPKAQISFYLTDNDDSEVTFGGFKTKHLASSILWADVTVESYWQVEVGDITLDNKPKNLCSGGCQVAVDTGTSMLTGPSELVVRLSDMVGANEDCTNFHGLPMLGFKIGDTVLNLRPDDYMDRSPSECLFSLMALDVPPPKGPLFIFGDPFLRRFVTIYDSKGPNGARVGFAVASHREGSGYANVAELMYHDGDLPGRPPLHHDDPSAVNLHLGSGFFGVQASDGNDDGNGGLVSVKLQRSRK